MKKDRKWSFFVFKRSQKGVLLSKNEIFFEIIINAHTHALAYARKTVYITGKKKNS